MTTQLKITGMSCQHCVKAAREALEAVPGVASANVSLEGNSAHVEHTDAVSTDALVAAVVEEGYEAEVLN